MVLSIGTVAGEAANNSDAWPKDMEELIATTAMHSQRSGVLRISAARVAARDVF